MPIDCLFSLNQRQRALLVALACAVALGLGLVFQHVLGWEPCPLCIAQRIGIGGVGVFALLLAVKLPTWAGICARVGATLAAAFGGYAAYEQLTFIWGSGMASCSPGLKVYMEMAATALPALGWLLDGPADCLAAASEILGLPLAAWVLGFLLTAVAFLWAPSRKR